MTYMELPRRLSPASQAEERAAEPERSAMNVTPMTAVRARKTSISDQLLSGEERAEGSGSLKKRTSQGMKGMQR